MTSSRPPLTTLKVPVNDRVMMSPNNTSDHRSIGLRTRLDESIIVHRSDEFVEKQLSDRRSAPLENSTPSPRRLGIEPTEKSSHYQG
jgi:hypothetical protein